MEISLIATVIEVWYFDDNKHATDIKIHFAHALSIFVT